MKRFVFTLLSTFVAQIHFGQPNCAIIKDSLCSRACELSVTASKHQGSKYSQELFDQAIALCPNFAYAYFEKSVPYLKQGLFREWKHLIDQAVELDHQYLLNRGINQVQFMRNYEKGLEDLDKLDALEPDFNIGYSPSGEYHAQLIRGICYQKLGRADKAIEIMEKLVNQPQYNQGLFDYLHIGIAYLDSGRFDKAKQAFVRQNLENELAETYFYYSQVFEKQNQKIEAINMLERAKELYDNGRTMTNSYYHYIDKIYYSDIVETMNRLNN